jgi:hypothetical protein
MSVGCNSYYSRLLECSSASAICSFCQSFSRTAAPDLLHLDVLAERCLEIAMFRAPDGLPELHSPR